MVRDLLHAVLDGFPPVAHAFGYGSGVFHQPDLYEPAPVGPDGLLRLPSSGRPGGPQLDFVFAVEDPAAWHAEVGGALPAGHTVRMPRGTKTRRGKGGLVSRERRAARDGGGRRLFVLPRPRAEHCPPPVALLPRRQPWTLGGKPLQPS